MSKSESSNRLKSALENLDNSLIGDSYTPEPFLMPVEDVFNIKGRGTVVSGVIEQGSVMVADSLAIYGISADNAKPVLTICKGVEILRRFVGQGTQGDHVGLVLSNVKKESIYRGYIIATPGSVSVYRRFKAEVYILAEDEGGRQIPLSNSDKPQFYFKTADISGTILSDEFSRIEPGTHGEIEIELKRLYSYGDRVKICFHSRWKNHRRRTDRGDSRLS